MAEKIGLAAVLDLSSFNKNVSSFISSITKMNKETAKISSTSRTSVGRAVTDVERLGESWSRVKDIVTGVFVIDVYRQIARVVRDVATEAISATEKFQTLQITLEAVLARDYAKQFGIDTVDAFQAVTGQAQALIGWVRQIAVTTPFSVESIAQALAYGQAFGVT